jgi:hypothetical protein
MNNINDVKTSKIEIKDVLFIVKAIYTAILAENKDKDNNNQLRLLKFFFTMISTIFELIPKAVAFPIRLYVAACLYPRSMKNPSQRDAEVRTIRAVGISNIPVPRSLC